MAEPTGSPSPLDAKFARKVAASRWALFFERLWPRLWLLLGVGGLFLLVSLLGVWPLLPEPVHLALLAAFTIAALAALVFAARVRFPAREEAVRRIERVSGVPHRPASSYEDTITANADDPRTNAIWQAHRARLAAAISRLRVGKPHPRTDRADPIALRALLILGVVAVAALVGDGASDRILAAFRLKSSVALASARLDAWVTPPSYTGRAPIMLADGARGGAPTEAANAKLTAVPERSILIVRASGNGIGPISLDVLTEGATEMQHVTAKAPEADQASRTRAEISELRYELRKSAEVRVMASGSQLVRWTFYITPDEAPKIALTKDPLRTKRGSLKLAYKLEDDYGVVSAEAKLKRIKEKKKPADPSKAWARTNELKGPRPPHEPPPKITLRLPRGESKEAQTYIDFGPHPYAGKEVILTLEARDVAGNVGRSNPIKLVLPRRHFEKPLARAVVEQRAKLMDDPRYRDWVLRALDALTLEPDGFIDSASIYLGLRTTYRALQRDGSREGIKNVVDGLWELALRIEDGDLSDAERALREAQDKLADALERGAPDTEIEALMQELRDRLNKYLQQLAKKSKDQMPPEGLDSNNQQLSQQELDRMMQNLEDMARTGSRDKAQQMLAQLRDLLERLQSGQMTQQEAQRGQMMMKKLDELGGLVGQQQRLMDDTYRENRRQAMRSPGGTQPGRPGERGMQQQGQAGQGQRGQGSQQGQRGNGQQPGTALSEQQRQLKEQLEQLRKELDGLGVNPEELKGAREAMENAQRALEQGDMNSALGDQSRALEQMRESAKKMADGMQQGGASRVGQNGEQRDPLGRPQRFQGPDAGNSVKVPDEIDVQRAREILEELRRRLAQPARPAMELDYFERLLRRF
jgi:uncharacterized protein (TIGR02302 family)